MELAGGARRQQYAALFSALGEKVSFAGSSTYEASRSSYWSAQEAAVEPVCIVTPTCTDDVATLLKTIYTEKLAGRDIQFAIRGGGHTAWAGSANAQDGVTIDLRALDRIETSDDHAVARVGAGATWGAVYRTLEPLDRVAVGARRAYIGVGGLLTGGGISYFSSRKGFACDNVVNYEVVLADGTVVYANEDHAPDLFRGLKGGSNNFGVVTRFDLATFHQAGDLWGGLIVWSGNEALAALEAFASLDLGGGYDENAAFMLNFASVAGVGEFVSINLVYTQPVVNPEAFRPFLQIEPQIQNTTRLAKQSDLVSEFADMEPPGRRQLFVTHTFKSDLGLIREIYDVFRSTIMQLPGTPGTTWSYNLQPITHATMARSVDTGGNVMGLDPNRGGVVVCIFMATWDQPADDDRIERAARSLNETVTRLAQSKGLWDRWIYLNYASPGQDVIGGYGEENRAKLQATSQKYDPERLFQQNVPGGFKLFEHA